MEEWPIEEDQQEGASETTEGLGEDAAAEVDEDVAAASSSSSSSAAGGGTSAAVAAAGGAAATGGGGGAAAAGGDRSVYLESLTFNQDGSCFIAGTTEGFRVYRSSPLTEFLRREGAHWPDKGLQTAAMLYRTSVYATVTRTENKKVKLWDDSRKRFIGELRSKQTVRNVCLARDVLAMVTDYTVYVYLSEQMTPVNIIHTSINENGLCALAADGGLGSWLLACPAVAVGAVRVHRGLSSAAAAAAAAAAADGGDSNAANAANPAAAAAAAAAAAGGGTAGLLGHHQSSSSAAAAAAAAGNNTANHVFQAHTTQLAAIVFNLQGTLIATASEKGTVAKIFNAADGRLLRQLRRGRNISSISCVCFRGDNRFVAVASSSETIHIFLLSDQQQQQADDDDKHGQTDANTLFPLQDAANSTSSNSSNNNNNSSSSSSSRSVAAAAAMQLPAAINSGKEITAAVYGASREIVQDAIKGVLGSYFRASRSFAQFHLPSDITSIDSRSSSSSIKGPLVSFAGPNSNHLFLLSPSGHFYELRFNAKTGKECILLTACTWFACRPNFRIQSHLGTAALPSDLEGGHEGDQWQLVL